MCILSFFLVDAGLAVMPPHPDLEERLRAEGTYDEYMQVLRDARSRGYFDQPKEKFRFEIGSSASQDTFRVVVILADFSDQPWTEGPDGTKEYFEDLLFSQGTHATGSMTDLYLEASLGKFLIIGDVYGWYRMPNTYAYYTDGQAGLGWRFPQNAGGLAADAIAAADDDVDFSDYDNAGFDQVEGLIVVHSGPGREYTGSMDDIHSHVSSMPPQQADGVTISRYSTQPEEDPQGPGGLSNVGVYCHEQGHLIFGLPDLYDTDDSSEGVGSWSLMGAGSWNNNGKTPSQFDAWCRSHIGFVEPVTITENEFQHQFPPAALSGHILKLWYEGNPSLQYFLVENRQKYGFDASLPGEGLIIYHVDESRNSNSNEPRYLVSIEQADGRNDLEEKANRGDSGDLFPGATDNREFSDRTDPGSRAWSGLVTEVAVWDISDSDSIMTANIDVFFSRPMYSIAKATVVDEDSVAGLGETVDYEITIYNEWADAMGVNAKLACADSRITIDVDSIYIESIPGRGDFYTPSSRFRFTVPPDMDTVKVRFDLTLEQESWETPTTLSFMQNIGGAKVLVVDDDAGASRQLYYTDALDSIGYTYEVWNKFQQGTPDVPQMKYPFIVWLTGQERASSLTSDDIQFLKDYIDFGGGLFLSGQDFVEHASAIDPSFVQDYLHCTYGGNDPMQLAVALGDSSSYLGEGGMIVGINQRDDDGEYLLTSPDWIVPDDESTVSFRYANQNSDVCGLELDLSITRIVLSTFGLESINDSYGAQEIAYNRAEFMSAVMSYLNNRQQAPNKPPAEFELAYPDDGSQLEGNKATLFWHGSHDEDIVDSVLFKLHLGESDVGQMSPVAVELADTQLTLHDLNIGSTYYWKVEAYDPRGASTFSPTYEFEMVTDVTPPAFDLVLIPNPVLPYALDVFAYPNEDLSSVPELRVTTPSGEDIEAMSLPPNREIVTYVGDYAVGEAGNYTISVCGTDVWNNSGCTDLGFAAARMRPGEPLDLESPSGGITVRLERGATSQNGALLVYDSNAKGDYESILPVGAIALRAVSVEPTVEETTAAGLIVDLTDLGLEPDEYRLVAVFRVDGEQSEQIASFVNPTDGSLTATAQLEGEYVIVLLEKGSGTGTEILPQAFKLYQNHPNPFNPETVIQFDLPKAADVRLEVFNILGQKVSTILDQPLSPGTHSVRWDGRSSDGGSVASGIYFYRIKAGSFVESRRMVLLK